jgi:hypothetical protein
MPDFDVEAFITTLDRMGMKLTAVPLADGKLRVNRWCMLNATEHAQQIEDLWTTQIGNDRERIDVLAAHLVNAAAGVTVECISSGPLRIDSQSTAAVDTAVGPHVRAESRTTPDSDFGAPSQEPPGVPGVQVATSAPTIVPSHPSAPPQAGDEKLPSPVLASILKILPYRQR